VDRLLAVELPETPLGLRDRALLEVLYASGLRAGEIVRLRLENYLREERLLRVIGKGNRERVVPVGEKAVAALDRWLARGRPLLVKPKTGGEIFLGEHGRRLTTARVWQIVQEMAKLAGLAKRKFGRISCAIRSPRICSATEPICARSRKCSATPASPPRRFTPTSIRRGSSRFIASFIRAPEATRANSGHQAKNFAVPRFAAMRFDTDQATFFQC
jgi:hypothetical protein